ncbi:MAG: hypothetical protein K5930_12230 [Treponemataceae bacterium]|nr:hypothetical protein [Treponemataceae bacterium]
MKLVEVLASALVLVMLFHALCTPVCEFLRLKKAANEVRSELYEKKKLFEQSLFLTPEGGQFEEKSFSGD